MGFKRCPKCDTMLSYNKFGCNKSRSDGMQPYCILCMRKARKVSSKKEKSMEMARVRQKKYRERLKEKSGENKLVKERTRMDVSITKSPKRNHIKSHQITLNPQPVKKSRG